MQDQLAQSGFHVMRLPEVLKTTGLSRSTVYNRLKDPASNFPRPIALSGRRQSGGAIGFRSDQIFAWLASLTG
jgi:predicted DNA-binding transcriptional regulator AlpA